MVGEILLLNFHDICNSAVKYKYILVVVCASVVIQNVRSWNAQRVGALLLFGLLLGASGRGVYSLVGSFRSRGAPEEIGEAFLEAAIPEPTPENLQK